MCRYYSLLLCVVIFVTFPPWSSQMTIILITNAMYHIRYKNSENEFKRKNPHGLITAKHQHHQPTWKTPLLYGRINYKLCRTNTRRACMASDGSGLLARRVLKHCPVLALVLVADPRSDRSRIQCPFRKTFGTAHTTSQTLVWLPSWAQPCQQSAHIPIAPKEFNSFHYH